MVMDGVVGYVLGWSLPALLFLVLGIALLITECTIPGFGICGITGLVCLGVSVYLRSSTLEEALITVGIVFAVLVVFIVLFIKSAKNGIIWRSPLVLKEEAIVVSEPEEKLIDKIGVCLTDLRPAGNALIDGKKYQVVSDSEYIRKGTKIKIIAVEKFKITVSEL